MLRQLLASSVTALKQQQPSQRLFARQLVQPALQQQTAGYASSDAKEDKPFKGTGYSLYFQVRFVAPGCSLCPSTSMGRKHIAPAAVCILQTGLCLDQQPCQSLLTGEVPLQQRGGFCRYTVPNFCPLQGGVRGSEDAVQAKGRQARRARQQATS